MNHRIRLLAALFGTLVLIGAAVGYTLYARGQGKDQAGTNAVPVLPGQRVTVEPGRLLFRNTAAGPDFGRLATVPLGQPGAVRQTADLRCDRFAASGDGTALCLAARPGALPPSTDVLVLDRALNVRHRLELPGTPSRARLSPDGRFAFWTLFVTGDSYAETGFSTRAGILEVNTGRLVKTIEELPLLLNGKRYFAADVNYWGITFAADGDRFYATMASRGRTHLVEAGYRRYGGRVLRENVECPALSPDGQRLAFKKRVADAAAPWRLFVLDLATMAETPLAEQRSVDDQALWQDDGTLLYALPGAGGGSDVWSVPADGSGTPRLLVPSAASPAIT
ncbi:PD40 domain-containing protein [Amycolatopsis nigrescens]|uniref:PD40 domain-containing protein n=1 Tax=Amycolatopsis nigrescens TaxID=381445 RepID=UPI000375919C|nr:PD40 domain-containing protein [Amycolatopsis nigrescens]